ncbi:MAG: hypothetical protein M1832_003186 [Thelocarpon impressellum]|nr:MAG: hypothetical protein M1832_003186 [Thelocarpon impressellum]
MALSLGLLGLLRGANALPAVVVSQGPRASESMRTILPTPTPTSTTDRHPVAERFLVQVQFIQDESKQPQVFNQTAPTFLNYVSTNDTSEATGWEVGAETVRAAQFQHSNGEIYSTGAPNEKKAISGLHSNRMLTVDVVRGKLALFQDGELRKSRNDLLWDFDGKDNLVLADRNDPRMKICQKRNLPPSDAPAVRFSISLGDITVPGPELICQNIQLHAVKVQSNDQGWTDVTTWTEQLPPNPSS